MWLKKTKNIGMKIRRNFQRLGDWPHEGGLQLDGSSRVVGIGARLETLRFEFRAEAASATLGVSTEAGTSPTAQFPFWL